MKKILANPRIKLSLKILFVGGLLYFLAQRGFLSFEKTSMALSRLDLVIPALLFMLASTFLGFLRWKILLKAQSISMTWNRTVQLSFVGIFFNIALPGAVSGDLIKAVYIGKEVAGKRARAFSSIFFDRIVGVSALVLVSVTALVSSLNKPWENQVLGPIQFFVGIAGTGVIIFYAYLFLVTEKWDPVLKLCKTLEAKNKKFGSLHRIYEGIREYHSARKAVVLALVISVMIHLLVTGACIAFTRALGETQIDPMALYILVPLGLLVTAVPVLPAGVGTGHAAFLAFFHLLGSERGADVFSLYVLIQLLLGAIGGLVYLSFRSHEPIPNGSRSPS